MTGSSTTEVLQHQTEAADSMATAHRHQVVDDLLESARRTFADRYRDIDAIGIGANGLVVHATPADGREPVALKIDFGEARDSLAHQRFEAEWRIGQRLHHRAIVPMSARQAAGSLAWFEMPYVGRGRLDLLLQMGPPPRARALGILRSLAAALDYAHANGVIHGALRPSKVHLLHDGRCMLSGFMLGDDTTSQHPALQPSAIGDPAFMAPEQRADSARLDGRVDQYALAIIAAELLLGTLRVHRGTSGVAELIPVRLVDRLRDHDGRGPNGADAAAIRQALLPDPRLRFPSATAFVEALNATHAPNAHGDADLLPSPRWHGTFIRRGLILLALLAALVFGATSGRRAVRRALGSDPASVLAPTRGR
jgi:serine/threonine protein kinase